MKKVLSIALILILLIPYAFAENALAVYTDEELRTSIAVMKAELLRRGGGPISIPQGCYVIGQDIPAGTYRVEAAEGAIGFFYIYTDATNLDYPLMTFYLVNSSYLDEADNAPEIGRVYLAEGMAIVLDIKVTLVPYEGVGQ